MAAAVRRYRLGENRELVISEGVGLVALSVHGPGQSTTGPLAVRLDDVDTIRSALLDLIEIPAEEATG